MLSDEERSNVANVYLRIIDRFLLILVAIPSTSFTGRVLLWLDGLYKVKR